MSLSGSSDTITAIIKKAKELRASLAGVASVASLQNSHSYVKYDDAPYYNGYRGVEWPEEAKSVLVLALAHELSDLVNDIPSVRCLESPRTRRRSSMSVCRGYRAESSRRFINGEAYGGRATHVI